MASKVEYDRLIGEWLTAGRQLPATESCYRTVEELLAAFWLHAKTYHRRPDGTETKVLDACRQAMKPVRCLYGQMRIADSTQWHSRQFGKE